MAPIPVKAGVESPIATATHKFAAGCIHCNWQRFYENAEYQRIGAQLHAASCKEHPQYKAQRRIEELEKEVARLKELGREWLRNWQKDIEDCSEFSSAPPDAAMRLNKEFQSKLKELDTSSPSTSLAIKLEAP